MITIDGLKELIINAIDITPMLEENSIKLDSKTYKIINGTISGTVTKKSNATDLEVKKDKTRYRFTFLSAVGVVSTINITFNEKTTIEVQP